MSKMREKNSNGDYFDPLIGCEQLGGVDKWKEWLYLCSDFFKVQCVLDTEVLIDDCNHIYSRKVDQLEVSVCIAVEA